MKGSRRQVRGRGKSAVWELRVYAGRSAVTGKPKYVSRTVHGTAAEADEALAKLVAEVGATDHADASKTLGDLLDTWLAHATVLKELSPTTVREHRRTIERTIKPVLGDVELRKLDGGDLEAFYVSLMTRKDPKPLSASSVRRVHAVIAAACAWGVKKKWLVRNPALDATQPQAHHTPKTSPTPIEVQRMVQEANKDDQDMAVLIALAAATGARRGELLGLKWSDVNFDADEVTFARSVAVVGGEWIEKGTKTDDVKVVPLSGYTKDGELITFARDILRRHRILMKERAAEADTSLTDDTPVFTYNLVHPISPDTASHYTRAIATRAKVDVHLHQLRHFAGTYLVGGDVDLATTQDYMGHSPGSPITLKFYAHPLPERRRGAAAVLGKALTPGAG